MKKKILVLSIVTCLILAVTVLCGCNAVDSAIKKVNKSLDVVATLTSKVIVTDQDVIVYSLEKTVTLDGDVATVVTDEASLGSEFVLEHNVTTETSSKQEQAVMPVSIDKDSVKSFQEGKNSLSCVVSSQAASTLFNSAELVAGGDVVVTYAFVDNKLQQMTCTYSTVTQKTVTIVVTCAY